MTRADRLIHYLQKECKSPSYAYFDDDSKRDDLETTLGELAGKVLGREKLLNLAISLPATSRGYGAVPLESEPEPDTVSIDDSDAEEEPEIETADNDKPLYKYTTDKDGNRTYQVQVVEVIFSCGAMRDIQYVVIKPKGIGKPLAISAGFAGSVTEVFTGKIANRQPDEPYQNVRLQRHKYEGGFVIARFICFDHRLNFSTPGCFDLVMSRYDDLTNVQHDVRRMEWVGDFPTDNQGNEADLLLETFRDRAFRIPFRSRKLKATDLDLMKDRMNRSCNMFSVGQVLAINFYAMLNDPIDITYYLKGCLQKKKEER